MTETGKQNAATRLACGVETIKSHQRHLAQSPGVYRMINARGDILYIGKARNLRARVAAYTRPDQLPIRLQRMIAETATMEFTITHSEAEALLLEAMLIKDHMPRYNIALRDDKSFPYIYLSGDHDFPRIQKHRGARKAAGDYFGPYMTAGGAVDQTITALQRAFLIRNCSDSVFSARKRPCLQYHIKRCSAPCVDYISKTEYADAIAKAKEFLNGKHGEIQQDFAQAMAKASAAQDYETAASIRDRIRALTLIQTRQRVQVNGLGDVDVIALSQQGGKNCVQIFFYRNDCHLGNHAYFPQSAEDDTPGEILSAFLMQFYQDKPIPKTILASHKIAEQSLVEKALEIKSGHAVGIENPSRGKRMDIVKHALTNATQELSRKLMEKTAQQEIFSALAEKFDLPKMPSRIEVYDNSHISGKNAVGAMIVATIDGFQKKSYRKFTIRVDELPSVQNRGGDDYGMMAQMLQRRFARVNNGDDSDTSAVKPDLVLIDGGLGQLNVAIKTLAAQGYDDVPLVAIAKGPDRNAGRERFFMPGRDPFTLPPNDAVLHYLQRLRDEAHRFAIGSHRKKRQIEMGRSELDSLYGIGAKRKKALLHHFGSVAAIKRAALADLEAVTGLSKNLSQMIYNHFHNSSD